MRWGREELDLDLRRAAPDSLPDDLPPVDIVSLWNVLEHVADPPALLRAIRAAMAPEGLLLVDVPNFAFRLAAERAERFPGPASYRQGFVDALAGLRGRDLDEGRRRIEGPIPLPEVLP